ncbi:hypothetical protein GCM10010412_027260 [Nonomuraea recticatena]|uniref:Uncharacterized protein n=1 Tax=Nonomuraea recticatena TaxID=46178 RepID=A0ABP6E3W6_9ACTN
MHDQAAELEWSGVRTMNVREHVLLGSPGFIPDHLQSHETPQSRPNLSQAEEPPTGYSPAGLAIT